MPGVSRWSVYMVRCGDGSLYTGIAIDVKRRLAEHSRGGARCARYLRRRGPLELVLTRPVGAKGLALGVEARIKMLPKAGKESLLRDSAGLNPVIAAARRAARNRRRA
ncbi:MAG TPA: GIY-YIG nuclease family protein [Candidatus Polarisedimenticolia bacterium]|nr:GIY-YIG nuclease family protein [Candidatus Polarisedimenticolia bacterium]